MAVCRVCRHPRREEIDQALSDPSRSYRSVAEAFGASPPAVFRHRQHSVGVTEKAKVRQLRRFEDFVSSLEELHGKAAGILAKAEKARNLTASTNALREIRQTIELIARLVGELKDGPSVNVLLAPEWHGLRTAILEALVPFPEARAAVSAALLERESAVGLFPTVPSGTVRTLPDGSGSRALPAAIDVSATSSETAQKASPVRLAGRGEV